MDETPLFSALKNGDLAAARALIEQGADVQAADSEGKTPLHYAAFLGVRDIVELLIHHGADVNSRDRDGLTPLHWVFHIDIQWDRLADHLATAKVLIQAGADMKAQTNNNQTAWEYIGYLEFVQLVDGVPVDAEMWHYVANRWDNRKRFEDALAAYQRARELTPRDSPHLNLSYYISPANILIVLNRYEEALALIEQPQALMSKPPLIILERKAHVLQRLGRDTEALATYQQSTDLLPEDAQAWLEQGRILNELGRHDEALDALQKASDLGTSELYDGWYVPHSVVKYLMEQEQYEDALRFIDRALEREPERLNGWALKWQILRKLDRGDDANKVEHWVADHEPADAGHWYLKGEALDEFGQHEEAMVAFERACALGNELPYNWLLPSTINHLCTRKRYTEALPLFERAIEHDPTDVEIRMWYGRILAELGRYDETLKVYQQVAERELDYARVWHDQGHTLRQLGRHEEAVAAYQKAVELEPHYISAWNNLGMSFNDLKRYEEALTAFRRANILNPNEAWYVYNMAWALDKLSRSEEALPLLDRVLEMNTTHVQSWRLKGRILQQLGRYDGSAAAYQQALALDPTHAYAWNRYGLALSHLKRYDEALTAFQRATQLDANEAHYWDNVAYGHQMLKQYKEALRFVGRALQCKSDYAPALKRKAWLITKLGQESQ
jgi:tetratricopeptide (TPR) repeat protein